MIHATKKTSQFQYVVKKLSSNAIFACANSVGTASQDSCRFGRCLKGIGVESGAPRPGFTSGFRYQDGRSGSWTKAADRVPAIFPGKQRKLGGTVQVQGGRPAAAAPGLFAARAQRRRQTEPGIRPGSPDRPAPEVCAKMSFRSDQTACGLPATDCFYASQPTWH
jgi:hypothetical protein